jgi:hypothetical protein
LSYANVGISQHRFGSFDVVVGEFWQSASSAAKPTGCGEPARVRSRKAALELSERTKHVKHEPPLCGRLEGFGQAAKPDASHPKIFDGFDQLLHRPRQPIQLPDDQRVLAARELEGVVKDRPILDRTPTFVR